MKTVHITIAKKDIGLRFDMTAMEGIEESFGGLGQMMKQLNEEKSRCKTICEAITILGNAAMVAEDKEPTITHRWISSHMGFGQLKQMGDAIGKAINEGMKVENNEEDENEPIDLVLLEEKKTKGEH